MATTLERLDDWLRAYRPDYHAQLSPGLTAEEVLAFEQALGRELPDAFKGFFRWRNGQDDGCYDSLVHNFSLMSADAVIGARTGLNGLLEGGDFDRANWWSPGWIPFLHNGGGDHYCLDLAGTFTGAPGQVLVFWHADSDRPIQSRDFATWLETVVTLLEADDFGLDEYGVDLEDHDPGYPLEFEAG